MDEKNGTRKGTAAVFLIGIVLVAEIFLVGCSMAGAPGLLTVLYDKITLPSGLLFVTHFKWLFNTGVTILACVPAVALMFVSELGISWYAKKASA